jgi:hypothetical protein
MRSCGKRIACQPILSGRISSRISCCVAERIPRILKDAADQLSGTRAAMIWLHFVGLAEEEFRSLVEFSNNGMGGGLNALVAEAVSGSSSKNRSHVNVVRFSGEPVEAQRHSTVTEEGVVHRTSMGGAAYDVRNPFARHQLNIKF